MLIEITVSAVLLLLGLVLFGLIFKNKEMTIADGIIKGLPFLAIIGFVVYLTIIGFIFRYVGSVNVFDSNWNAARNVFSLTVATILFLSAVLLLFKFLFKDSFWGILSFWFGWSQLIISAVLAIFLTLLHPFMILLIFIPAMLLTLPYAIFPKALFAKILFWIGWVSLVSIGLWFFFLVILDGF